MKRVMISAMALAASSLSAQTALWTINHNNYWYNYPISSKRVTGHAKINRSAKKRRSRK